MIARTATVFLIELLVKMRSLSATMAAPPLGHSGDTA